MRRRMSMSSLCADIHSCQQRCLQSAYSAVFYAGAATSLICERKSHCAPAALSTPCVVVLRETRSQSGARILSSAAVSFADAVSSKSQPANGAQRTALGDNSGQAAGRPADLPIRHCLRHARLRPVIDCWSKRKRDDRPANERLRPARRHSDTDWLPCTSFFAPNPFSVNTPDRLLISRLKQLDRPTLFAAVIAPRYDTAFNQSINQSINKTF